MKPDTEMEVTGANNAVEVSIKECRGILDLRRDEWRMEYTVTASYRVNASRVLPLLLPECVCVYFLF